MTFCYLQVDPGISKGESPPHLHWGSVKRGVSDLPSKTDKTTQYDRSNRVGFFKNEMCPGLQQMYTCTCNWVFFDIDS